MRKVREMTEYEKLSRQLAELSSRLEKVEARAEIENLMGRYQYLHMANMDERVISEIFAQRDDITFEDCANGVYPGDGIRNYFFERYGTVTVPAQAALEEQTQPPVKTAGRLVMHTLTTPVIEVSSDGESASGLWLSVGNESAVFEDGELSGLSRIDESEPDEKGRRHIADWVFLKFGADFVRENGRWRVLHMHIYDIFRCPFDEDWVSFAERRFEDTAALDSRIRGGLAGTTPWRPTTFHWQYSPGAVPPYEPAPPVKEQKGQM